MSIKAKGVICMYGWKGHTYPRFVNARHAVYAGRVLYFVILPSILYGLYQDALNILYSFLAINCKLYRQFKCLKFKFKWIASIFIC